MTPAIRPITPADDEAVVSLTAATSKFRAGEIDVLRGLLAEYHEQLADSGHRCRVVTLGDEVAGFSYVAPVAMTESTWNLYWLVIAPAHQARGLGRLLLGEVEAFVPSAGGTLLLIETSSLPSYEQARRFYLNAGYHLEARVRDYYFSGDDLLIYRKPFPAAPSAQI